MATFPWFVENFNALTSTAPINDLDGQGGWVKVQDTSADAWVQIASSSVSRADHAAAGTATKFYVFGGQFASGTSVEEYDPATNLWTTKAPLPAGRRETVAVTVAGKIYVIGGMNNAGSATTATVYEYNPTLNSWATKTSMGTARAAHAAAAVGTNIYVFGGRTGASQLSGTEIATVEIYDTVGDLWSTGTAMPTARQMLNAGAVGTMIYVIGGDTSYSTGSTHVNEEYDTVGDSWITKASGPGASPMRSSGCAVLGGLVYIMGGEPSTADTNAYDPGSNTWTTTGTLADMVFNRQDCAAATVGSNIYVSGRGGANDQTAEKYYAGGTGNIVVEAASYINTGADQNSGDSQFPLNISTIKYDRTVSLQAASGYVFSLKFKLISQGVFAEKEEFGVLTGTYPGAVLGMSVIVTAGQSSPAVGGHVFLKTDAGGTGPAINYNNVGVTNTVRVEIYNSGMAYIYVNDTLAYSQAITAVNGNLTRITLDRTAIGVSLERRIAVDDIVGLVMVPPLPPSAPINLVATGGDSIVTLGWTVPAEDGGTPITGYRVYRGLTSGSLVPIATIANVLAFNDLSVVNGITYYYQVAALNAEGESGLSNEDDATPDALAGALLDGPGRGHFYLPGTTPLLWKQISEQSS